MTQTESVLEKIRRDPENLPGRITAAAYNISALLDDLTGLNYEGDVMSALSLFWFSELIEIGRDVEQALKAK
ncbi:MAG: hypothetical protein IJJ44_00085 [Solobacterium sp.]|nr:hypothetical protein [Solobacterium sp.]